MRLTNPTPRVMARAEAVTIPSIYLLGLKNGACPPLNFFTNKRIEAVTHSHSEVHTRMLRPFGADEALSAEKIQLLDLPKMISIWGSDDKHTCLTPMRFKEASKNFLAALTLVSEAPSTAEDGSPIPTFASEYQKHFDFFDQLRDFEETYPIWYRFELVARRDILKGIHFDWDVYALEVKMLLHSNVPQLLASSSKRLIEADNRVGKFPRNSFRTDVSSRREETSIPTNSRDGPTCLLCGKGHPFRNHPATITSFEDGKHLFSRLLDSHIWSVRSFRGPTPRHLCIYWNLFRLRHSPRARGYPRLHSMQRGSPRTQQAPRLRRVVHPYNVDGFRLMLDKHNLTDIYPRLLVNLIHGFPLGRNLPRLKKSIVIPNHRSVNQFPAVVQDYIATELAAGHMSGPFSLEDVERILRGPIHSSPFLVSEQFAGPGLPPKYRVCRNLSKADPVSGMPAINSFIDKDDFLTSFNMALRVAAAVADAPPGTQGIAFDIKTFHRTCPILSDHKPYLVASFQGKFYIDYVHPFGARLASSNAGQIGNATVDIWQAESRSENRLFKYEDDIQNFRYANPLGRFSDGVFTYFHNCETSMVLIDILHIPWHPEKSGIRFTSITTFIGFQWDLTLHRVSLPQKKRVKYLACIVSMLSDDFKGERFTLHQIQQIHGTLVHWQKRLGDHTTFRQLCPIGPVHHYRVFVDASMSWGIGIIIGPYWHAFRLAPGWKRPGRDICWLETLAIELAILFMKQLDFYEQRVEVFSDNSGAIGTHIKNRSPNIAINLSLRGALDWRAGKLFLDCDLVTRKKPQKSSPGVCGFADGPFTLHTILLETYRRVHSKPPKVPRSEDEEQTYEAMRVRKEREVSEAFLSYLSSKGAFEDWEKTRRCSNVCTISVNQAGLERSFSDLKIKKTRLRNRLKLPKLEKMAKVGADICTSQKEAGFVEDHVKRQNHDKAKVAELLAVPRYADMLDEDGDTSEDEGVPAKPQSGLVKSRAAWQKEMAKWV
ncbi:hypothetical protein LshimejAT787_1501110 [Lyophyllum shimeji]|uniref:Uncharacterized protein n=1 Tax=Lyophyllum shimeji TaxID=47721 RepID=A0A9P3PVW3_LYOSH|nr:hypothetical protein LshimejAT787_1501110 [Lyophyllum shimeji]